MQLEYKGNLEQYLDKLDSLLLNLAKEPDEEFLHAIVESQLRLCKAMVSDFMMYDAAPDGVVESTAKYLCDLPHRHVDVRIYRDRC
jgi:hypothetical protein